MSKRIVKGIADSYVVNEAIDPVSGNKFLEVYEHVVSSDECFVGEWLCDIDGTMSDTDEHILNEIDAALD